MILYPAFPHNFIQEKTSLVWTLSSSERGIFYAYFSSAWYCEIHCADLTNFCILKSFFRKMADFYLFPFLTNRGLFFHQVLQTFRFLKIFWKNYLIFTPSQSLQVDGVFSARLTNFRFYENFFRKLPHFLPFPFLTSEGYFSSVSTNL